MTVRKMIALAIATATLAAVPTLSGASGIGDPICTTDDRGCQITSANAYLASLVSHDASEIPLHPDAQRYENGNNTGDGAEAIAAANEGAIMYVITGIRDLRWYVEGDQAVSVYLLDSLVPPSYIFERFQVNGGLIQEIEARFYIDIPGLFVGPESVTERPEGQVERFTASNHGPLGPVPVQEGNEGDTDPRTATTARAEVVAAVDAYLAGIDAGDSAGVPLGADVVRTVNRVVVGSGKSQVAQSIDEADVTISDITVHVVDGDAAIVFYDQDGVLAAARIRVTEDAITEIEEVAVTSF